MISLLPLFPPSVSTCHIRHSGLDAVGATPALCAHQAQSQRRLTVAFATRCARVCASMYAHM